MYPKESSVHIAKWFLGSKEKSIGHNLLKWVNTEKALNWLSDNTSYVHSAGLSIKSIVKIIESFENPKLSQNNISSAVSEPAINTQLNWSHDTEVISNLPEGKGLPNQTDGNITYMEISSE